MRDQIRSAALAFDAIERLKRGRPGRLRRLIEMTRRLRPDVITSLLAMLAVTSLASGIWLLWTAQPFGGGDTQSALAITQGASFIFVVVLTTLLLGPLEAGRTLGSDAAWIARDARTWTGLATISALSIVMLLLGWAEPDSREELSTIFLSAFGLSVTGLLVRRLLRLSDPLVQLQHRRKRSVRRLGEAVRQSKAMSESALRKSGVANEVVQQIQRYADPTVQAAFARELRGYSSIARAACGRNDWHLATGAFANAIAVSLEYLRQVESVADSDEVILNLLTESDDLNQLAQGPAGRPFAEAMIQGMRAVGLELISIYERTGKRSPYRVVSGLSVIARSIQTMAARELTDLNATGPASAVGILADFAMRALSTGAWGSASHLADILVRWAIINTNAARPHVATPAWAGALKLLVMMFKLSAPHDSPMIHGACSDVAFALEKVDPSVIQLPPTGLDPILESSLPYEDMTLQVAWYELWRSDCWSLGMVAEFGRRVAWRLTELLRGIEDDFSKKHYLTNAMAEVLYQFICAASTRAESERDPACRNIAVESVVNSLGWLRGWMIPQGGPDKNYDNEELMHCYVSGWQVLLFLERGSKTPRPEIVEELRSFLSDLTVDVTSGLPALLPEGLSLIASWLRTTGYEGEADEARAKLDSFEGPSDLFAQTGWGGLASPYFTRRGDIIAGIVSEVETYFGERQVEQ